MLGVASGLGAAGASVGAESNKSKIKNINVFNSFLGNNNFAVFAAPFWRLFSPKSNCHI